MTMNSKQLAKFNEILELEDGPSEKRITKIKNIVTSTKKRMLEVLTEKCISCELYFYQVALEFNLGYLDYQRIKQGLICDVCYESDVTEPNASIYYKKDEIPIRVGDFTVDNPNMRPMPFHFEWQKTDGWRGHYELEDDPNYVEILDDAILRVKITGMR